MLMDDFYNAVAREGLTDLQRCVQRLYDRVVMGGPLLQDEFLAALYIAGDELTDLFHDKIKDVQQNPVPEQILFKAAFCFNATYQFSKEDTELHRSAGKEYNYVVALIESFDLDGAINSQIAAKFKPIVPAPLQP